MVAREITKGVVTSFHWWLELAKEVVASLRWWPENLLKEWWPPSSNG